ncbi:hypothetical protein ACA910_015269 [Epithemia clementina (nom. ined.)]
MHQNCQGTKKAAVATAATNSNLKTASSLSASSFSLAQSEHLLNHFVARAVTLYKYMAENLQAKLMGKTPIWTASTSSSQGSSNLLQEDKGEQTRIMSLLKTTTTTTILTPIQTTP